MRCWFSGGVDYGEGKRRRGGDDEEDGGLLPEVDGRPKCLKTKLTWLELLTVGKR